MIAIETIAKTNAEICGSAACRALATMEHYALALSGHEVREPTLDELLADASLRALVKSDRGSIEDLRRMVALWRGQNRRQQPSM